ncbi:MAG: spermidine synthase [Alphaproteobacteria bacterium]
MTEQVLNPLPLARQTQTLALFCLALFTSAAAMFMVQPMVGKMLLPLVGGTPAGWIVAMAFFQVMLLAGYSLAWGLARFSPRIHGAVFVGALLLGGTFLPVQMPAIQGEAIGAFLVFKLLLLSVGAPFVALSAASSTLQRLFTATGHPSASDPYFLYAASNLGSFAGLLIYPGMIEPMMTLPEQAHLWFYGYAALVVFASTCLLLPGRTADVKPAGKAAPLPMKRYLKWVALAFFPSSLMLGVTTHITTDLVAAPMIWVVPLGLYLLTFVAAFAKKPLVSQKLLQKIHPTIVAGAVGLCLLVQGMPAMSGYAMVWHLITFTVVALLCHMLLAEARPLEDERHLPGYYLLIALGGALGGILNAFVAPMILDRLVEYPAVLLLSCLVNPRIHKPFRLKHGIFLLLGACAMVAAAAFQQDASSLREIRNVLLVTIFIMVTLHPRATLAVGALLLVSSFFNTYFYTIKEDVKLTARNFYGTVRVYDHTFHKDSTDFHVRYLRHGTTTHSMQILNEGMQDMMASYYANWGPMGDIYEVQQPRKVAVMGLGAGTLACYKAPDRSYTFFEIDPLMADIANKEFTYLKKCPGAEPHKIIIGDARLEMAKLPANEKFDVIVMDAFSSDMVPVHLLTQEAITAYFDHLAPGGVIAANLSNRYIVLEKALSAVSDSLGLQNRFRYHTTMNFPYSYPSKWMIIGRSGDDMSPYDKRTWVELAKPPGQIAWTDDYSSVASILKF